MPEHVADAITRVENVLRDLIEETLRARYGQEWLGRLGVSEERLESWKGRQEEDGKRRGGEAADTRLLYYAELHDLVPILKKNWQLFSDCLGERKEIEVYLRRLGDLRHPHAHGRALLPFEENLVLGISGDIRQRVTVYRSSQSPESEFFARMESVKDSLGNVLVSSGSNPGMVNTRAVLQVGDEVVFSCSGWDPSGQALEWTLDIGAKMPPRVEQDWSSDDSLVWRVSNTDIGRSVEVYITMRSQGRYHARGDYDDSVIATYTVLPARAREQAGQS